jgi:ATP-dependent Clp protease ATP-binding subunit ClpA
MEAMQSRMTDRARKAIRVAAERAASCHRQEASAEDVLWALAIIEVGPGRVALESLGLNIATCVDELQSLQSVESPEARKLIGEAHSHARAMGHRYVGTEHLALALLSCGECPAATYLRTRGITVERLRGAVKCVLGQ